MSFFDDASLAFLPSGAAGKDGKAYSIKPVPEYGSELVTNGDFASNINNWAAKDCTIVWDNGKIKCDNSSGNSGGGAYQNVGLQNNKTYRFIATIQIISASGNGAFRVATSAANGTGQSTRYTGSTLVAGGDAVTEIGEFTTGTDGDVAVQFNVDRANAVFTIDNVSVQEVLVGDGDFTFSRGSNLSATRVGADGLIEKGRENLLVQSNQFDTTWTTSDSSVTGGQSGYDGSNNAWKLQSSNSSTSYIQQSVSASGVQTMSVYAKAGTTNFFAFYKSSSVNAFFNLSNGSVGNTTGVVDTNVEDVGDGWYRCSMTFSASTSSIKMYLSDANGSFSSAVGSNILIQSAQLESGLAATEVISTGATTGKAGLLEDEPRFDYSGGATCPSLLLEPSRTNLATYSEYIQGLSLTGLTATPNATTSPEGVLNAYKVLTGTGNNDQIFEQATGTSGNTKTQSVYIKADSGVQWIRLIQIRFGFANSASTWFDIQNGVKGSKTEGGTTSVVDDATKIEDAGNGWYRLTLVCTDSTNNTTFDTRVRTAAGNSSTSRVSNGSYFVWGYQMESNASYPTSYIPNHSGGSVTRGADVCNSAGDSSTFNDSEGVLYTEISALANDGTNRRIVISDGTFNNSVQLYYYTISNRVRASVTSGGITSIDATAALSDATNYHKIAIRYKTNDFSLWVDGVEVGTDTSGNAPSGLNQLNFNDAGGSNFYGKTKQILTFKTALSDSELATLTTL